MTWTEASTSCRAGSGGFTSATMGPNLPAPSAHIGVGRRLRHQIRHNLAQLLGLPAVLLVLARSGDPALGHADVAAHHVEDAARDVLGLAAAQPDHYRRDVGGVERIELLGLALRRLLAH